MTAAEQNAKILSVLTELLAAHKTQIRLLQALVKRQSTGETQQSLWKSENPELSKKCSVAANKAAPLLNNLIEQLADDMGTLDIDDWQNNFPLYELIDVYGYKLPQFNTILQILTSLGN